MTTANDAEFHRGFEFDFMATRPMYAVCPRWRLEHSEVDPAVWDLAYCIETGSCRMVAAERVTANRILM